MEDMHFILKMQDNVLAGDSITPEEALKLLDSKGSDALLLFSAANRIREKFTGNGIHICGIVNAKSGACSENCNFCSQSASHPTAIENYSLLDPDSLVDASRKAASNGAKAFGIVTAWKGIKKGKQLDIICEAIRKIKAEGRIVPDLSLGLIDDPEVAVTLAEAGAIEYNHNLESGPSFFPNICTTHSFQDRVTTIQNLKLAGLRICSGGIFGLGETNSQRIELAFELKKLDVQTTPLNFYHHTDGNAVTINNLEQIKPLEALTIVSVFRFVLPHNVIKIAGGRETTLKEFQSMMFLTGANSTMVGHYLTTSGRTPQDDLNVIKDSGLYVSEHACSQTPQETLVNS